MDMFQDYRPPGVLVSLEFEDTTTCSEVTEFHNVIIGNGITTRKRKVVRESIKVNKDDFPFINFTWDVNGEFNFQHFPNTMFTIDTVLVHRIGENGVKKVELERDVDYQIKYAALARSYEGSIVTTLEILEGSSIKEEDIIFDIHYTLELEDDAFDLKLVNSTDKIFLNDIFGSLEMKENGEEFFNDIGMAAEIAFKLGVEKFYYLEIPRNYGERAKPADFRKALEKIYYEKNAYRIVPLTDDPDVVDSVTKFVNTISNPYDRRETVAFISAENNSIKDHQNLSELVDKVGGLSESFRSPRINNIYCGSSVELPVGSKRYVLPAFFMNVAVSFFDSVIGMSKPLSTRAINVFSKLNGPRFRPAEWNELAKKGVFIVHQERVNGPVVIRHQLTTALDKNARVEQVEYSITKNLDATTQLVRDRLSPLAGKENITDGFFEKVDAAFTGAIEDAKEQELVRDITVLTPWELRKRSNGLNTEEVKTNIVGKFKVTPLYPGNNIDVVFVI